MRDAAQLHLLERFRSRLGPGLGWKTEVLVGEYPDQRAWDALVMGEDTIGVDAETRLCDIQAVQRKVESKWRDSGVVRVVLVVASTHHNRRVLREYRGALSSTFPLDTGAVMKTLRSGSIPSANGIVVL